MIRYECAVWHMQYAVYSKQITVCTVQFRESIIKYSVTSVQGEVKFAEQSAICIFKSAVCSVQYAISV